MFRFCPEYLDDKVQGEWAGVQPYPHVVIDNFLPEDFFAKLVAEVPKPEAVPVRSHYGTQGKSAAVAQQALPDHIYNYISEMNSGTMLRAISQLTGIEGLIPDPYVYCGGVHQTRRKGYLGIHADYTYLAELRLDRRLNMLLYLNEDWNEEWGGHLGMWSRDLKRQERTIAPVANRLVIMATDAWTWHGHPEPLACPDNVTRNSIAIYYYTSGRPKGEVRYRDLSTRYEIEGGRRRGLKALIYEANHFRKNRKRIKRQAKIT